MGLHLGCCERVLRAGSHHLDGLGEHFAAIGDRHSSLREVEVAVERRVASSSRDLDQPVARAVRIHRGAENASVRIIAWTDHHGAGGIGKQHGAGALGRIDAAAEDIGGYDEARFAVKSGESVGEHQRIDEAGAGAGQIDRAGADEPQPMRDQRRAGRQEVIGRRGGKQQKTDVAAVNTGVRQRHVPACAARPDSVSSSVAQKRERIPVRRSIQPGSSPRRFSTSGFSTLRDGA
ncbi:hypothetical protein AJ88_46225 [Mesorhizobium amorphae CCBAU 01583]|nr:hypothetical protein AJ88_46225 [Mesorhizobium amorphae CCBAU 01583]